MKAALYARYSTIHQRAESIEDQFRVCERVATDNGFQIKLRFEDREISGGTKRRPGYQSLLAAARGHEFTVLIAEDMKRLWREQAEQWRCIKELIDLGVILVTASGIDSRQPNFVMLAAVIGAAAELDRREAGYRIRRGLEGQALRGGAMHPCYGYVPKKRTGTGQVEISPAEAEIVRWIFDRYVGGWSPLQISRELRRAEIPPPSARFESPTQRLGWTPQVILGGALFHEGIILRDLYAGVNVWGRSRVVSSVSDSKSIRRIENPQSEWIYRNIERLRIIPEDIWCRAQVRAAVRQDGPGRVVTARNISRRAAKERAKVPHTFSSLLKCDACGADLICSNSYEYICGAYRAGTCSQDTLLSRKTIHKQLTVAAHTEGCRERLSEVLARNSKRKTPPRPWLSRAVRQERRIERLAIDIANLKAMMIHPRFFNSPGLLGRVNDFEELRAGLVAARASAGAALLERRGESARHNRAG